MRKTLLLVAVAALVATAGCNTGNTTPTGTAGDNVTVVDSSGDLNGPGLNAATAATVESAGSYTVHRNALIVAGSGQETNVTTTTQVDFESQQGLRVANQTITGLTITPNITREVYTDGNTSYERQESVDGVTYNVRRSGDTDSVVNPVNVTGFSRNYTAFTAAFDFEENGTTQIAGVTTTRYSSVRLADGSPLSGNPNATVTNASATFYLDDTGAVRRLSVEYEIRANGNTNRVQLTDTIYDVGSTTVSEPDWVSAAQANETSS